MNRKAVLAIARKDIQAITANVQVWLPMLVVPLILGVVVPLAMVLGLRFGASSLSPADVQMLLGWADRLPAGDMAARLAELPTLSHRLIYVAANYVLAPFFLLIPLMAASVIAADSFAGEKERGTLETLLLAPVDLASLFAGKVLAAFAPAMALSLATLLLCAVSVNAAAWPLFHQVIFPRANWIPLVLLVIPAVALLAILLNVFISARVATFQAAYQMGGMVVLPLLLLVLGQVTGILVFSGPVALAFGLGLLLLDGILLWQVVRRLDRQQLFASQVR